MPDLTPDEVLRQVSDPDNVFPTPSGWATREGSEYPMVYVLAIQLLACREDSLRKWDAFDRAYSRDGLTDESARLFLMAHKSQRACLPEHEEPDHA